MPDFIPVTNRLGQRMLVNVSLVGDICDEESSNSDPNENTRIDFAGDVENYIHVKEPFNQIAELLTGDTIRRSDAIQARPKFLNEERSDPEMAAYARGWNAAVSQYLAEIRAIGRPDLQEMPAES